MGGNGGDGEVYLSIVIPVKDEEGNVIPLYDEITGVMANIGVYFSRLGRAELAARYRSYEIIFVDDGSRDSTFIRISSIRDPRLKVIKLRRNFGQSAAMLAGFDNAKGRVVVTIDGDRQNDPRDIPRLLAKVEEGCDCVSGWRNRRKDSLPKKLFSRISNVLRHAMLNDVIHDSGCSLKAYKRECLEGIELYGEMHRYIVSLVALKGFRIGEIKVLHHPRRAGRTKYSTTRLLKGFLDLFNIWFSQRFAGKPFHLFGGSGLLLSFLGVGMGIVAIYEKIFRHVYLAQNFLASASVFFFLIGLQLFLSGLMVDIMVKSYYQKKGTRGYEIERIAASKR